MLGRHLTTIGIIPSFRYSIELLFGLSNAAIMYAFILEPHYLDKVRDGVVRTRRWAIVYHVDMIFLGIL